jgi:mercuric ion binding protein
MKYLVALAFLSIMTFSFGQIGDVANKKHMTSTLTVYGKCGMCKDKIEETLAYTRGVSSGEWNVETKVLTVNYNSKKTDLAKIKQALADMGYDSETHRATEEAYNNLHACCKYERPTTK